MPPVIGVVNVDDKYGRRLAKSAPVPVTTFSAAGQDDADWRAAHVRSGGGGGPVPGVGAGGGGGGGSVGPGRGVHRTQPPRPPGPPVQAGARGAGVWWG